jgi:hypothetical protein
MKVKELIAELGKFDPELIVALADWNEGYRDPTTNIPLKETDFDKYDYDLKKDTIIHGLVIGQY